MTMKCPACGEEVPDHERLCPTCGHDCGSQNVRAASRPAEIKALEERYASAEALAEAAGTQETVKRFEQLVASSKAAHVVRDEVLMRIANSENEFITSFYRQVRSGSRVPLDNEFDPYRAGVDARLFPHYHESILFGALTLTGRGARKYGGYTLLLKGIAIRNRATVFEENSFKFSERHKLGPTDSIPLGFRANWEKRQVLAIAKLSGMIEADMSDDVLRGLLLTEGATPEEDDFVEVHILGLLNVRSIERVVGSRGSTKSSRAIQRAFRTALKKYDVPLEAE